MQQPFAVNDCTLNAIIIWAYHSRNDNRRSDLFAKEDLRGVRSHRDHPLVNDKPVIGGDTGTFLCKMISYHTEFLVDTPGGAALRIRNLTKNRNVMEAMARKVKQPVLYNFLATRHLRKHLTLMFVTIHAGMDRIEL